MDGSCAFDNALTACKPEPRCDPGVSFGTGTFPAKEGIQIMVRKILLAASLGALTLSATACNTVRGAAADVESVANEVDDAT